MGPALRELMKDEINAGIEEGLAEAREESVKSVVWACKRAGLGVTDIVESVIYGMDLSLEEAEKLVKKYW